MSSRHPAGLSVEERVQALNRSFPQKMAEHRGRRTAYRETGSGPAVVMLHGIGSGAGSWLDVATALAPYHRVLAWDAPGYGDSSALDQPQPKATDYAVRLHDVVADAGIDEFILVGHSLGALMARAFVAGRPPFRVRRLVLLSPALGYGEDSERRGEVRARRLDTLENLGVAGIARQRSTAMLSGSAGRELVDWVAWNTLRITHEGYRQAVEMLCGDDLLRYRHDVLPLDVHVGQQDTITTPQKCAGIAQALGVGLGLIPTAGHACHIETPEAVSRIIRGPTPYILEGH